MYAERITMDPLCIPGPSRMAPLAPGNPAPGTIKMARWLRNFYDTATPSAMSFMNDRLAARMRIDLGATTNALKRLNLLFAIGLQETLAGRPDLAAQFSFCKIGEHQLVSGFEGAMLR